MSAVTTLISYQSSGGDQGRCDAKCYDAHEPDCDCICGGRNHGAGKQQAIENTRELAEGWIEQARASGQDIALARAGGRRDARAAVQPGRCTVTGPAGQAAGVVKVRLSGASRGRGGGGRAAHRLRRLRHRRDRAVSAIPEPP